MWRPPDPLDAVVVWRDQAEHAAQSLTKGSRVVVLGKLQQRTWTAEDGSAPVDRGGRGRRAGAIRAVGDGDHGQDDEELVPQPATLPLWRLPLADPSTVEALTSRILGE
jgi:Single-strand binding protein family